MNYDIFNLVYGLNLGGNLTHTVKHNFGFYFNSIYDFTTFYSKEEFERDNGKSLTLLNQKIGNLESQLINSKKN